MASGHAITRLGKEALDVYQHSMITALAGGDRDKVDGPLVTDAAQKGDPVAIGILSEVGRRLGEGIAGLVNILDPEVVVIGGGAIAAGDLLVLPATEAFERAVEAPAYRPSVPILAATLGNDAGAVGAASLAIEELLA